MTQPTDPPNRKKLLSVTTRRVQEAAIHIPHVWKTTKFLTEALTDKVHIILCSLKEVPKRWEDCRTEIEEVLFLIKNMEKMDNTSLAYKEGRYAEIFDAARSNRLSGEDVVRYSDSLEKLRDIKRGMREQAEEARAEGRAEEKREIARKMLAGEINLTLISAFTGLSEEEIREL